MYITYIYIYVYIYYIYTWKTIHFDRNRNTIREVINVLFLIDIYIDIEN